MPVTAVPVFPRRLFCHDRLLVTHASGIEQPRDLIGRSVGIHSFHVTLSVLAKGDLKSDYGVPWEKIHWFTAMADKVAFSLKQGIRVDPIPDGANPGDMLAAGELDAFFSPQPPRSVIERLDLLKPIFPDPQGEEARYYQRHGYYPIMHVLAERPELIEREPWLAAALADMYDQALNQCREYYDDPNYSMFPWSPYERSREADQLAAQLWPSGLKNNRAGLERFLGYCHNQGLIHSPMRVESLFAEAVLDS